MFRFAGPFSSLDLELCVGWHQNASSKPKCDVNCYLKDVVYSGHVWIRRAYVFWIFDNETIYIQM